MMSMNEKVIKYSSLSVQSDAHSKIRYGFAMVSSGTIPAKSDQGNISFGGESTIVESYDAAKLRVGE